MVHSFFYRVENLMQKSFRNLMEKSMLMHAVAMDKGSGGVLLLGHSGAGKTTLSKTLSKQWSIIADDIVFLAQQKNDQLWYFTNAKLLSSEPVLFVPLVGVIRVIQSTEVEMVRTSPRETCRYLLDGIFENDLMRNLNVDKQRESFINIADLARNIPGWRLNATLGEETPKMILSIFKKI